MRKQSDDVEMQRVSPQAPQDSFGCDIADEVPLPILDSSDSQDPVYNIASLGDSPTAIRVLDVEKPGLGDPSAIRCCLRMGDLADKPTFTALSYVCGDSTVQKTIWCDDRPFSVTQNAWHALGRLRTQFAPLMIWIDAVCIDQDNVAEKSRQISLMGAIYSSAAQVYIWLGEGNEKTNRAMRDLASGALTFKRLIRETVADDSRGVENELHFATAVPTGPRLRYRLTMHLLLRRYFFLRKVYLYSELNDLFANSWIKRVWTLQEVLLASTPVLVCGDLWVSWFVFLCAMEVFEFYRKTPGPGDSLDLGLCLPSTIDPWLEMTTIWKSLRTGDTHSVVAADPDSEEDLRDDIRSVDARSQAIQISSEIWPPGHDIGDRPFASAGWPGNVSLRLHVNCLDKIYERPTAIYVIMLLPIILITAWITGVVFIFLKIRGEVLFVAVIGMFPIIVGIGYVALIWAFPCQILSYGQGAIRQQLNLMAQIASRQCTIREDYYHAVLGIIRPSASKNTDDTGGSTPDPLSAYRSLCLDLGAWAQSLDFLL